MKSDWKPSAEELLAVFGTPTVQDKTTGDTTRGQERRMWQQRKQIHNRVGGVMLVIATLLNGGMADAAVSDMGYNNKVTGGITVENIAVTIATLIATTVIMGLVITMINGKAVSTEDVADDIESGSGSDRDLETASQEKRANNNEDVSNDRKRVKLHVATDRQNDGGQTTGVAEARSQPERADTDVDTVSPLRRQSGIYIGDTTTGASANGGGLTKVELLPGKLNMERHDEQQQKQEKEKHESRGFLSMLSDWVVGATRKRQRSNDGNETHVGESAAILEQVPEPGQSMGESQDVGESATIMERVPEPGRSMGESQDDTVMVQKRKAVGISTSPSMLSTPSKKTTTSIDAIPRLDRPRLISSDCRVNVVTDVRTNKSKSLHNNTAIYVGRGEHESDDDLVVDSQNKSMSRVHVTIETKDDIMIITNTGTNDEPGCRVLVDERMIPKDESIHVPRNVSWDLHICGETFTIKPNLQVDTTNADDSFSFITQPVRTDTKHALIVDKETDTPYKLTATKPITIGRFTRSDGGKQATIKVDPKFITPTLSALTMSRQQTTIKVLEGTEDGIDEIEISTTREAFEHRSVIVDETKTITPRDKFVGSAGCRHTITVCGNVFVYSPRDYEVVNNDSNDDELADTQEAADDSDNDDSTHGGSLETEGTRGSRHKDMSAMGLLMGKEEKPETTARPPTETKVSSKGVTTTKEETAETASNRGNDSYNRANSEPTNGNIDLTLDAEVTKGIAEQKEHAAKKSQTRKP